MSHRIAILCMTIIVAGGLIATSALAGKPTPPPMTNPAISYIANAGNTPQVFIITANGAQKKQLTTNKGGKRMTAWSPDGNQIAYVVPGSPGGSLWRVNKDGTGNVKLCNLRHQHDPYTWDRIDWSPDGNWIVYAGQASEDPPPPCEGYSSLFELWAVNVHDCSEARLTLNNDRFYSWPFGDTGMTAYMTTLGAQAPTWSPDLDPSTPGYQTRIAFSEMLCLEPCEGNCICCGEIIPFDLMYIPVDIIDGALVFDANQVPVPLGPLDDAGFGAEDDLYERCGDWDSAGSWVIYTGIADAFWPSPMPEGQYKISLDGSQTVFLWSGVLHQNPRWSPDSAWYTTDRFTNGSYGIYRVRNDAGNPSPTFLTTGTYPDWNPAWVNDIGY